MIPVIVAGMAVIASGVGVKKGLDAKEKIERAERIVNKVKEEFEEVQAQLLKERDILNSQLEEFAKYKIDVFQTRMKKLVDILNKCKKLNSKHKSEKLIFTPEEIKMMEDSIDTSYEISAGLASGATSGALTAFGVYGSVGALASASTGTAIASLSGAAATNATLAWLGGGSLAAGGFGVAGGMAVMGGLVAGPAIAVTGLMMDSKAEKSLTEAKRFRADTQIKIEKMRKSIEEFNIIKQRIGELEYLINIILSEFDKKYNDLHKGFINKIKIKLGIRKLCEEKDKVQPLLILGKSLKDTLDISILDKEGNLSKNFNLKIEKIEKEIRI